jgi:hypothetical protein
MRSNFVTAWQTAPLCLPNLLHSSVSFLIWHQPTERDVSRGTRLFHTSSVTPICESFFDHPASFSFVTCFKEDGPNSSAPQGIAYGNSMVLPCLGMGIGLAPFLAGCKETMLACENFVGPHVWHNRKPSRRMLNSSSTKVAASEGPRRYPPHFVWPFAPRMDLGECNPPLCASVSSISIGTLRV